jgi:hypothetical protein
MENYYSIVFTPTSWATFLDQKNKTIGFRSTLIGSVRKLDLGDILICYVSERMSWAGALKVTRTFYEDTENIFSALHRMELVLDVEVICTLSRDEELAVKEERIWSNLERFRNITIDSGWAVKVGLHRSLRKLSSKDSKFLLNEFQKKTSLSADS